MPAGAVELVSMAAATDRVHIDTRSSSPASVTPSQTAALRGAATAFAKPQSSKRGSHVSESGGSGARVAASRADQLSSSNSRIGAASDISSVTEPRRLSIQRTGESSGNESYGASPELGLVRKRLNQLVRSSDNLQPPPAGPVRVRSPSQIAATLAASRSNAQSPNHDQGSSPIYGSARRPNVLGRAKSMADSMNVPRDFPEERPDITSIPSTNSLIRAFEAPGPIDIAKPAKLARKSPPRPIAVSTATPPDIKSPKPLRTHNIILKPPSATSPSPKGSTLFHTGNDSPHARIPSMPFGSDIYAHNASPSDSLVSVSEYRPSPPAPRAQRKPSGSTLSAKDVMTIDSMANAIVASSLAASRTSSPAKSSGPPLPLPRRPTTSSFFHHHIHDSRTPSPSKGLRTTLRHPAKTDDEPETPRRGRKHLMTKPNKHHEGDRKRWRDVITERERKRYEAVWASNRGLLLLPSDAPTNASSASLGIPDEMADSVANYVVRDIWARSRLGEDVLEEVWDLVDRSGSGKLSREEFVAGLWLIDQRLKGRKLPIRVSESVWSSLGSLGGVKVRRRKR